jgi:hypothetical protein
MKRSLGHAVSKRLVRFLAAALLVASSPLLADTSDPNQLLAFKKIYVEHVQDNVDGTYQAPVEQSYKEIFDRNPRFELVSDKSAADSAVRTVITKKATGTDIEITLVVLGTGEIFSTDKTSLAGEATGKETGGAVKALLKTALKRIPFYGTITGRDSSQLTFDIGMAHGLKKGDVVQISRVDNIKRHPLLKSIVDVQMVPAGSAVVDNVEDTIAFGHVNSEIAGEQLKRLYKVTAIESRAPVAPKEFPSAVPGGTIEEKADAEEGRPELGFVALGPFIGGFTSSTSQNGGSTNFTGSTFNPGFKLSSEIWLTKRWFADIAFGYSAISYSQQNALVPSAPDLPGVSSSTREFSMNAGYKYLPDNSVYGPQAYVKVGYYSFTFDTAVQPGQAMSPKMYSGFNLGVGGLLPVTKSYDWGVRLDLNILLFPSLSESGFITGPQPSATVAGFYLGGYHHFNPQIAVRAGVLFDIYSANFSANSSSTSQKVIGFTPALVYYF